MRPKAAQSPPPLSPPPLPESPEPKLKPEPPLDPADGMLAMMRPARRENGRHCSHTCPGRAAARRKRPRRRRHRLDRPARTMSNSMPGVKAARQPVSTCSCSPGRKLALDHRAADVHEDEAVALELLHDEAFAAEQAGR